ncbi:unnamed protein product [Mytilus coruscus]|uniref:Uncharacterized protein n=1 Tax=Mytilus coruscus TaxID=42192 RepID=A0A6J8DRU5_MYTCO|nr:unnamed protein product [Mytilus coruscus]
MERTFTIKKERFQGEARGIRRRELKGMTEEDATVHHVKQIRCSITIELNHQCGKVSSTPSLHNDNYALDEKRKILPGLFYHYPQRCQENFSTKAAVSTMPGTKLISKFLPKQLKYVDLKNNLIVDIDCEAYLSECECQNDDHCQCDLYATPVRFYFKKESGYDNEELMNSIKHRKGEPEMSQAYLVFDKNTTENLRNLHCVVNFIASSDIDTLVINLLSVNIFWPSTEDQSFKWSVYLWLQKKKPEIYAITGIISLLEQHFNKRKIVLVTCALAMGVNDICSTPYEDCEVYDAKILLCKCYFTSTVINFVILTFCLSSVKVIKSNGYPDEIFRPMFFEEIQVILQEGSDTTVITAIEELRTLIEVDRNLNIIQGLRNDMLKIIYETTEDIEQDVALQYLNGDSVMNDNSNNPGAPSGLSRFTCS